MIAADTALAGIVREAAELGSPVESANGVCAPRPEAHGRNLEERQGVELTAFGAAHRDTKVVTFDRAGNDRMIDPLEVVAVDVLLSAERPLIERALRSLISNRAFRSIERRAVGFALQKILTDFRSDLFQHEADVGEDGVIAPDAVLGLQEIPNADCTQYCAKRKQRDKHDIIGNKDCKDDASNQTCRERCKSHGTPTPLFVSRLLLRSLGRMCARRRSGAWRWNGKFAR